MHHPSSSSSSSSSSAHPQHQIPIPILVSSFFRLQNLALLLLLSLFISPAFSHPILPEQILLPSSPSSSEDLSVSALSQSSLSLRPDWLQQKVRPDSEWQRKMELLLGRTNLIKSAEQEAFQEATRKTATRKGNESFRAAIKQILLGIH